MKTLALVLALAFAAPLAAHADPATAHGYNSGPNPYSAPAQTGNAS
jgi:hypothetical protein